PIGIPFFWPTSSMPNTVMPEWSDMVFLKLNDATFSATTYPKLALVWPGLKLTDTRGEFIRIWDDGRGVDSGRALLSAQGDAMQRMTGSLADVVYLAGQPSSALTGPFSGVGNTSGLVSPGTQQTALRTITVSFDTQNAARTASETRSRNIAFNFLVRAK
ncbi:TPA: phage tail protein, partial [Escherichia coli]